MMKIQMKGEKDHIAHFTLKNSTPAYANALRRTMIGNIPVMAIRDVDMYENNSLMFDEYIAHRLGLVPLTTNLKTYKLPEECCGGNCAKCSVTLSLDVEGPKTVYSEELKSSDSKITPVEGKIPIMKLGEGQRLRLEAKAMLGYGAEHARWQASHAFYTTKDSKDFEFEVETFGALTATEIIERAIETLKDQAEALTGELK